MRKVIAPDPFIEKALPGDGTIAGGAQFGACCGLIVGGFYQRCRMMWDYECVANGGFFSIETCQQLQERNALMADGSCWFRRCQYETGGQTTVCLNSPDFRNWECYFHHPCTEVIIGKCNEPTTEPCSDELGPCCKAHLGGGCEDGYAEVRCVSEYGIFMGVGRTCSDSDLTCPTDDVPEGCRGFEPRTVPLGLRQWSTDVCAGVALDACLDPVTRDTKIVSERMRLFGVYDDELDPCVMCQTLVSFDLDGDANAPFVGNATNNDPVYNEHYTALFVLDEQGLYGQAYDAILVASFKTPPWAEFLFMSHGTYCKGPEV